MNNTEVRSLLIALLCLVSFFAGTVEPAVRFKNLTVEHGLSQVSIKSIVQDHKGFLWFGTNDGLNRYDGYHFKHYRHDPDEKGTLSSGHISAIYVDSSGVLWVGTEDGGLNKYDRQAQRFSHFKPDDNDPNSLSSLYVSSILQDNNGTLWVGTKNGLNQYDPENNNFIHIKHRPSFPNSLSNNHVNALYQSSNGALWVGTDGGLNQFNLTTRQFKHFNHDPSNPNSLTNDVVTAITEDNHGNIWIGTKYGGLNRYDTFARKFKHFLHQPNNPFSIASNAIWTLKKDDQGNIWVGTDGKGLDQYDEKRQRFLHYQHRPSVPHSISHDAIRSIYQDSEGLLWIGTLAGGVNRIDTNQKLFGHYKHFAYDSNSLSHNTVVPILEDSERTLWIGTLGGGVNRMTANSESFEHLKHDPQDPNSLSNNDLWGIFEDSKKRVWFGTRAGLNQYDKTTGQFIRYQHNPNDPNSVSHDWVSGIAEDSDNNLWVSTRGGGLNMFDATTGQFTSYRANPNDPNSITSDSIINIYTDSEGFLWLSTWKGGLEKFDPYSKTFTHHLNDPDDPTSLSNNIVLAVTEDAAGTIWAATLGGGLNKYNRETKGFTHYREKDGLANDVVYGLLEDKLGNLWLSTNQGLSKFNPKDETFRNYTVDDGLQSNEFNGNAFFRSPSGELFFGGINGFNRFYPENIKDNKSPPILVFTDFLLFNKSVAVQTAPQADERVFTLPIDINELEELTLNYKQSLISFEFAALNFHNPKKNQYMYKLEGVDKDWITTSANIRRATYTNLPSGEHTLRVRASNPNGYWNNDGVSIKINVLPPPWRTWWAYTIYFLTVSGIIGLFLYQQVKKRQVVAEHNKQLRFALWGSGDELWDINLVDNSIVSQNRLELLATTDDTSEQTKVIGINLIHDEDKEKVKEAIKKHLEGELDFYEATYRAMTTTGQWIWLLDRGKVSERDDSGQPIRICGTTKNIHQLKVTEEELRVLTVELEHRVEQRTSELKQSNDDLKNTQEQLIESEKMAALGNLVVGISHEINTPVGIAITAISTLKDHVNTLYEKLTTNKLRKQDLVNFKDNSQQGIALALSNMYRTSRLVEYFKQIAVNQSGEQLSSVDVGLLVEKTIEASLLQDRPNTEGFTLDCPADLTIKTYQGALTQIITQLVQNTVAHGYALTDEIDISVKIEPTESGITIYYEDKGKGMDLDTQKQVFDPFYTTNRGNNIGLGMHVTYNQICHLLRGTIKCQSAPNEGCSYTISLPCSHQEQVSQQTKAKAEQNEHDAKLLEENPDHLRTGEKVGE